MPAVLPGATSLTSVQRSGDRYRGSRASGHCRSRGRAITRSAAWWRAERTASSCGRPPLRCRSRVRTQNDSCVVGTRRLPTRDRSRDGRHAPASARVADTHLCLCICAELDGKGHTWATSGFTKHQPRRRRHSRKFGFPFGLGGSASRSRPQAAAAATMQKRRPTGTGPREQLRITRLRESGWLALALRLAPGAFVPICLDPAPANRAALLLCVPDRSAVGWESQR